MSESSFNLPETIWVEGSADAYAEIQTNISSDTWEIIHASEDSGDLYKLYRKYTYTRTDIMKYIKQCEYTIAHKHRIYWVGGKRDKFLNMLYEYEWTNKKDEYDIENKYEIKREAFDRCLIFTELEFDFFTLVPNTTTIDTTCNNQAWIRLCHIMLTFFETNQDLSEHKINHKLQDGFTIKELIRTHFIFKYI